MKDISTPDFSTPSFNLGPFNPGLFKHEFLSHGVEKFMVDNSEVEKSGVEMSFNRLHIWAPLVPNIFAFGNRSQNHYLTEMGQVVFGSGPVAEVCYFIIKTISPSGSTN